MVPLRVAAQADRCREPALGEAECQPVYYHAAPCMTRAGATRRPRALLGCEGRYDAIVRDPWAL